MFRTVLSTLAKQLGQTSIASRSTSTKSLDNSLALAVSHARVLKREDFKLGRKFKRNFFIMLSEPAATYAENEYITFGQLYIRQKIQMNPEDIRIVIKKLKSVEKSTTKNFKNSFESKLLYKKGLETEKYTVTWVSTQYGKKLVYLTQETKESGMKKRLMIPDGALKPLIEKLSCFIERYEEAQELKSKYPSKNEKLIKSLINEKWMNPLLNDKWMIPYIVKNHKETIH